MHPSEVLFQGTRQPVSLPVCDHYAGSEKLMRKSLALQQELGPVFDITFDCEDGAAAGNEEAHARLVASLLGSEDNRFNRIGARVHDLRHPSFAQDVAIIGAQAERLAYFVLPKPDSLAEVEEALAAINRLVPQRQVPLHVLIESYGALRDAERIAALPQVECLSFGIMDFVSAHYGAIPASAMRSPGQFSHPLVQRAKVEIAAACHAHGKVPSHSVTTEIRDLSVVADDARRAAGELGYTRMWSIHPNQIKPIVAALAPSMEDVADAAAILAAARDAQWGPIQHQGTLHDRASYRYYWTVLQRARRSGLDVPASVADMA
ncbi:citrate lyase subunit beta / citryl-CoA lyase [Noviherbaspirillum humi]|uniref:Citrate lyase subunit beta / citryl-CoA lyase n=1 Tax=Noviherbaspirillum humi TaxID=1688639 RepID=A0A239FP42_9BURK|nr:aldolase/citrate lyase family protein [Noviherbaspirillum humi]SNS58368.1 citrate lyase subunit beta / citryl-CoA lyase [Noviherbaspirillum humi]